MGQSQSNGAAGSSGSDGAPRRRASSHRSNINHGAAGAESVSQLPREPPQQPQDGNIGSSDSNSNSNRNHSPTRRERRSGASRAMTIPRAVGTAARRNGNNSNSSNNNNNNNNSANDPQDSSESSASFQAATSAESAESNAATIRRASNSNGNSSNSNNNNIANSRNPVLNRLRSAGARVLARRRSSHDGSRSHRDEDHPDEDGVGVGVDVDEESSSSTSSGNNNNQNKHAPAVLVTETTTITAAAAASVAATAATTTTMVSSPAVKAARNSNNNNNNNNRAAAAPTEALGDCGTYVDSSLSIEQKQRFQQQDDDVSAASTVSDIADDEDVMDNMMINQVDHDDADLNVNNERVAVAVAVIPDDEHEHDHDHDHLQAQRSPHLQQQQQQQLNHNLQRQQSPQQQPQQVIITMEYPDFYPPTSREYEWMGRSIESLLLGHQSPAPVLQLLDDADSNGEDADYDFYALRRRSTASTFGGARRRSTAGSMGSFPGGRRGSLSLSGNLQGGTLASYYSRRPRPNSNSNSNANANANYSQEVLERGIQQRRGSTAFGGPATRRRNSVHSQGSADSNSNNNNNNSIIGTPNSAASSNYKTNGGPNVLFHIMARESTGHSHLPKSLPATQKLRKSGGHTLFQKLDQPAAGMATEVSFLAAAIDTGDWAETHVIVSRLVVRLIGDPAQQMQQQEQQQQGNGNGNNNESIDDPNLPPQAHKYYAGGGRLGLERDAFVQAGGVSVLLRMFREKSFVGQEMAHSYDARDLGEGLMASRLAGCWNEALASLRELVYYMPVIVQDGSILDQGDFLPFLFSLLSHDSCFDGAAALIEEILSFLSQTQAQQPPPPSNASTDPNSAASADDDALPGPRSTPARTFFLGDVPDLYKLWRGFNCRQLAHFCRILALLVFEPEDRQLLERPAVLRSLELLQLRRSRAAKRESTVDQNQAIVLGDPELLHRLLRLLTVMNYAPPLRRFAPYHVLSHFPFVADTLVMLGLGELEQWDELERQDALARQLLATKSTTTTSNPANASNANGATSDSNTNSSSAYQVEEIDTDNDDIDDDGDDGDGDGDGDDDSDEDDPLTTLCELGAVADMLDDLSSSLNDHTRQPPNQISHIIQVISAAQQAGVVVGRARTGRRRQRRQGGDGRRGNRRSNANAGNNDNSIGGANDDSNNNNPTMGGLASVAGILTDQLLVRRLYQGSGQGIPDELGGGDADDDEDDAQHLIRTPEDAANSLQFNAMLLGPYQVEVLFVLCTLLGGRRKLDAQDALNKLGVVPVLDDMFQRLPWYRPQEGRHADPDNNGVNEDGTAAGGVDSSANNFHDPNGAFSNDDGDGGDGNNQPNGIHGPGCECTPESALCVQYLRMIHNFCDRDCDNYEGRRLMLSESEKRRIFSTKHDDDERQQPLQPGLLTKLTQAFVRESDESPYRFWLASCIESFLRGSSLREQLYVAQSGLLDHLVEEISSDKLHCAGSLQTSFDLMGELGKGNADVVGLLVNDLDEESFRKLMSVAAANLVDSNVFIRSLLLSLERLSARNGLLPLYLNAASPSLTSHRWISPTGPNARSYLSHSWWDAQAIPLDGTSATPASATSKSKNEDDNNSSLKTGGDFNARPSDWFPSRDFVEVNTAGASEITLIPSGLTESVGHFGWVFTPVGETLSENAFLPNTVERLSWFLAANQARLLRDLLGVVDLRNINHENICCLNTAVVIAIFAHRRKQLALLLNELRRMNEEEKESKRRARDAAAVAEHNHDVVDRAFAQALRYVEDFSTSRRESYPYARRASLTNNAVAAAGSVPQIGDRSDAMRNFREVLWFWTEYYTHRGRDRLSLEFSSHIRFQEWNHVVSLLVADDGSATALVRSPVRLPRSPYQRAARLNPVRGE